MAETAPDPNYGFKGLLADLDRLTVRRETVPLGVLLDTLGARGHGPIILLLALLMILPTGMLPLMPVIIGTLFVLTAVGMLVGGDGVSVPARLARVSLPAARLHTAFARLQPLCDRLGRLLYPRAPAWVEGALPLTLIALILIATGIAVALFGIVPGLPFLLCLPALILGAGLTAGDGRAVALGLGATLAAGAGAVMLLT